MSDETKRREKEEKEERRRREIEELMQSMERTAPRADTELLKSLQGIELSAGTSSTGAAPEHAAESVPPTQTQPTAEPVTPFLQDPSPVPPSTAAERVGETHPSVLLSHAGPPPVDQQVPASREEVLVLRKPEPSAVEATIIEVARAAREYPYPETSARGSVRVSEDTFSRITMIFANQRIDKILVLSYLLYRHVPGEGSQRVPQWLLDTPPKVPRPRILVFIKEESLTKRLSDIAIRFGVTEADIIENIVRKHLPEAPFQYKPKRRMRFSA